MPLQQLAGFSVPEPRVLVVNPYDKGAMKAIEKAIQTSDLGVTPTNDGSVIRLAFPELTADRRKRAREGREAPSRGGPGRGAQRAPSGPPRARAALAKDGELSDDDLDRVEKDLETAHQDVIAEIDQLLAHKEHELLGD